MTRLTVKSGAVVVKPALCYREPPMTAAFREVAVDAAIRAGALLRAHAGGRRDVSYKGSPNNLVTEMDRRAEALIVDAIGDRFPDHAILAEERGALPGASPHRWIIDPLDGTTNYAHGFPVYCVSIALEIEGSVVLGVVYDPNRAECFVAERGRGATVNGAPLRVSATARLGESLVSTGYQYDIRRPERNNLAEHAALLQRSHSVREIGSAVLNQAAVAAGRLDAFWELSLGAWDVAAGALLVEEAGGTVTDTRGGPLDLAAPSILASNGIIHDEILNILTEVRSR
jgi:myo-inositol-1(or 4)-monophosphatase